MGHIFISYNHQDVEYADKLSNALQNRGFEVWIDEVIEYGSEWPLEIQEHLDACEALVLIMTPASYESKWVQNELNRAMRKNKPIFPLLLDGDEPWLSVEATQYTDVRGGKLPPERFYKLLAITTSQRPERPLSPKPEKPAKALTLSRNTILIFVVFTGIAIAGFSIWQFLALPSEPTPITLPTSTLTPSIPFTETSVAFTETSVPTTITITEIISEFISPQDSMISLHIPAGPFIMGSNDGNEDTRPRHKVILSDYWIDKTEVTNQMYHLCVENGSCPLPSNLKYYSDDNYALHPVVYTDWESAQKYCEWAGRRLPTEAEWEKAARGPSGASLPWEGLLDCLHANYGGCGTGTKAVGSYPQGTNLYGALDMFGNAWEWVYDKYDTNYYKNWNSSLVDPAGPALGKHRILRGAAWDTTDANRLQITFRYNRDPSSRGNSYGFRCATSRSP